MNTQLRVVRIRDNKVMGYIVGKCPNHPLGPALVLQLGVKHIYLPIAEQILYRIEKLEFGGGK